jgi:SpoVK/Ycf46/Vps4 family AAA+-type ATPase
MIEAIQRLARLAAEGRGVSGLFLGMDGAGKTLAAETLAREARTEVYTVDLSQVVSKFIGETEKNLDARFADAERTGAALFFDEADALFGDRTDVQDSHDRYANQVITYLLQRIESYPGVAILASNRKPDIDAVLLRRFRVIFPPPEPRLR